MSRPDVIYIPVANCLKAAVADSSSLVVAGPPPICLGLGQVALFPVASIFHFDLEAVLRDEQVLA